MTLKTISIYVVSTIFSLGLPVAAMAQTSGAVHGTVVDPSGALIPQAQVTVTNAEGFSRTLKSDDAGAFAVSGLEAGTYTVIINAMGFTPALESVQVAAGAVTNDEVKLGISVAQEVEVLADAR